MVGWLSWVTLSLLRRISNSLPWPVKCPAAPITPASLAAWSVGGELT